MILGIVIVAILVVMLIVKMIKRSHENGGNGNTVREMLPDIIRTVIISVLVIWYCNKLMLYKGIPVMLIWVFAVVFIYSFITSKTAFGRYFYAVGGNEKATKLSGIDTRKVYFAAYMSMSFLAGLSGLLMAARIASINSDTGTSFEMEAIGSCFISGASAYGGSGTVAGICIGALFLGVINQGMSIIGLDNNWQYIVKGSVLLIAVIVDVVSNHKKGKA